MRRPPITARDATAIVGLGMIGAGCWLVAPALALVLVGVVLLGAAVWGHLRGDTA